MTFTTMVDMLRLARIALGCGLVWSVAAGCSPDNDASRKPGEASAQNGGQIVALLVPGSGGAWASGLDPATNASGSLNLSMMNAIFGGLFQLTADDDGSNPRIVGVLADGYEVANNGRTLVVRLKRGVRFSDGTPFNAEAIRFNIERNIETPCPCAPLRWPWAKQDRVVVIDEHTVALNFSRPYSAAINNFPVLNINWPVSPTALAAIGEKEFRMRPVGAGPFKVVSNQLSVGLELERNSNYLQPSRPFLDRIIFQSIGSEQAAYLSLLAGDAQVVEGITSTPIIEQALGNPDIAVTQQPATATYAIQLNTRTPPFDDERARRAIYLATDVDAIRTGLFKDWYPVAESFMGPGGLFYKQRIPGYPRYDLDTARALVKELGGLKVRLGTSQSFVGEQVITALQSQWKKAGIDASIEILQVVAVVDQFDSRSWQALLQRIGSYDPESANGVALRFGLGQRFSGVADEALDKNLTDAAAAVDAEQRSLLYSDAAKRISDRFYAPFLVAIAPAQLVHKGVNGPGLTTRIPPIAIYSAISWQDVRLSQE